MAKISHVYYYQHAETWPKFPIFAGHSSKQGQTFST